MSSWPMAFGRSSTLLVWYPAVRCIRWVIGDVGLAGATFSVGLGTGELGAMCVRESLDVRVSLGAGVASGAGEPESGMTDDSQSCGQVVR